MLELRWLGDQASLPASDLNGVNTRGFGEREGLTAQMKEKEGEKKEKRKKEREKKRVEKENKRRTSGRWLCSDGDRFESSSPQLIGLSINEPRPTEWWKWTGFGLGDEKTKKGR